MQETLLVVAKKMPGFTYDPTKDSFKGWLLRVTQWKVADQFRRRSNTTATIYPLERVADPAGFDLQAIQAIWNEEWQTHLLHTALDRVKRRVQPALYEMYYLHVVKEQPVRAVARTLGVSAAQVYLAKHRVGALVKQEFRRLRRETT